MINWNEIESAYAGANVDLKFDYPLKGDKVLDSNGGISIMGHTPPKWPQLRRIIIVQKNG